MQNKSESYSRRQLIGFVIALPLFIILLLMDAPEGLAVEGWRVFAIAALMAIAKYPATIVQLHQFATVLVDREAASKLEGSYSGF